MVESWFSLGILFNFLTYYISGLFKVTILSLFLTMKSLQSLDIIFLGYFITTKNHGEPNYLNSKQKTYFKVLIDFFWYVWLRLYSMKLIPVQDKNAEKRKKMYSTLHEFSYLLLWWIVCMTSVTIKWGFIV